MRTKRFNNRNAAFEISGKTIRKNYFSKNKNKREYEILLQMQELFIPLKYKEWTYELVEVLEGSRLEGILMKLISGEPMDQSKTFSKDYYYHAGLWLGHFHKLSRDGNYVKAFGDYSFSNLFISKSDYRIIALDPSGKGMSHKNYYYDILTFIKVAFLNNLRGNHKYNSSCIKLFLKGYNQFGSYEYNSLLFEESTDFILKDFKESVDTRYSKIKSIIGYLLLKFHLTYFVKKQLKNYSN